MLKSIPKLTVQARTLACLAVIAAIPFSASVPLSPQAGGAPGSAMPRDVSTWTAASPMANPSAGANSSLENSMRTQAYWKGLEQLNQLRHKEMSSDTEKLLALANQLKAETDKASTGKASQDALSLAAVRQAEQIEKLAHNVREKMRTSVLK
jgi:hypothetical protein